MALDNMGQQQINTGNVGYNATLSKAQALFLSHTQVQRVAVMEIKVVC